MNSPAKLQVGQVLAELDADTMAALQRVAERRGVTPDAFAADAIRRATASDDDLHRQLAHAADQFARGDYVEHDQLVADLRRWRTERVRPRR